MRRFRLLYQQAGREGALRALPSLHNFLNLNVLQKRREQTYLAALALSPLYASESRDL